MKWFLEKRGLEVSFSGNFACVLNFFTSQPRILKPRKVLNLPFYTPRMRRSRGREKLTQTRAKPGSQLGQQTIFQ